MIVWDFIGCGIVDKSQPENIDWMTFCHVGFLSAVSDWCVSNFFVLQKKNHLKS